MQSQQLSKTDFANFLVCPEAFWLSKHKPAAYPQPSPNAHSQLLAQQGYEFEAIAQRLLQERLGQGYTPQETLKAPGGLLSRPDGLFRHDNGAIDLYEIKSGSNPNEYKDDLAFQLIVARRSGLEVRSAFLVHTNKAYVLGETVDPEGLVKITDLTVEAKARALELEPEVDAALTLLKIEQIDESQCSCLRKTRSKRCTAFEYFNPDVPSPSIHHLPRIWGKRIKAFVDAGIIGLDDLELSDLDTSSHIKMLTSYKLQKPTIDRGGIAKWLGGLTYPLSFFDYESFASPVPVVKGSKPWQHVVTQYSLHVLHKDGELDHVEYLSHDTDPPDQLAHQLRADLPPSGNVISWNKSFENSRNKEMGQWLPKHADFFRNMEERTRDLMLIFDGAKGYPEGTYIDWRFMGSASIKIVLPVLIPDLSYDDLDVSNGTEVMVAWRELVAMPMNDERAKLRKAMLDYCRLDTLAMVRIFQKLESLC
ncbi:MAG: DUF2779 domain-containing protein [Alphaproteobacteria bacterium]